jgi:D-alanyl-D-alanine endopeptidase (penicillin-binding protein 7)
MIITTLVTLTALSAIPEREKNGLPHLRSESVMVRWADTGEELLAKNADEVRPIASVTKLMSALVLDAESPALLTATRALTLDELDKDRLKWSRSSLRIGKSYPASQLFQAAMAASDNRAICALARHTGLERATFVAKMNQAAQALGMSRSRFVDPAGLDPGNVSTARDLLALVSAAAQHEVVRQAGLVPSVELVDAEGRTLRLGSTNRLARSGRWTVLAGKTGYTIEAGRALVLRVEVEGRPLDMVYLGAREMQSVFGDAGRVKRWILAEKLRPGTPASASR